MNKLLVLGITALLLQSCATIMTGTKQSITFNSEPSNATVYLGKIAKHKKSDPYWKGGKWLKFDKDNALAIGKTPITVEVKKNTKLIFILKDGYKDTLIYCYRPIFKLNKINEKTGLTMKTRILTGKYAPLMNWWYFGNILNGYIIGYCVDVITRAEVRFPNEMNATLNKR